MALPKQQLPIFQTKIPSTGELVKYRGFTVKEEKALLLAQETDDPTVILNAIIEVLEACLQGEIDVKSLAHFDVEYLITMVRAKSVGEVIELSMYCDTDPNHRRIPVTVDVSKIEVKTPLGHNKVISLYDDVGVTMKYPTVEKFMAFENMTGVDALVECIDNIFTTDEVFDSKDQTREELLDFVQSLTKTQFRKIEQQFFKTMPTYEHEIEYKCSDCGHVHKKVIRGISNFFV